MRLLPFIGVAVALIVILIASSVFRVDERKQALVLQFGQVRQVVTEPGLGFKVPLIQDVVFYEDRILPLETSALEVTPADERRLVVDAFARWRIVDVVQFRQSVQTETNATQRLERILNAALREVLGSVQSSDVLSPERTVLMSRIRDAAREEAEALGVEVIDVRIRRADLPEQNLQATFNRMEAERQREAADERARGEERAQEIRATADREAVELVSDAQRQSEVIRGQADAERNNIFAQAFGRDQEFFAFYRSLSAYEKGLRGSNSTMVITPDSEFFDYLRTDRGEFGAQPAAPVVVPDEGVVMPEGEGPDVDSLSEEEASEGGASSGPPNVAAGRSGSGEAQSSMSETGSEASTTSDGADDAASESAEADATTGSDGDAASGGSSSDDPADGAGSASGENGAETVTETVDGVTITRTVDDETESGQN